MGTLATANPTPINTTSNVVTLASTVAASIFAPATSQTALVGPVWVHALTATSVNVSLYSAVGTNTTRLNYINVPSNGLATLLPYTFCLVGSNTSLYAAGDTTVTASISGVVRQGT